MSEAKLDELAAERKFLTAGNIPAERRLQSGSAGFRWPESKEQSEMDHNMHPRLGFAELTEANLVGAPIYGADDEKVGTIAHLHGVDGADAQAVIDVGGFLGIGSKPVLVALDQLNMMRDTNGNVHGMTSWTKDQLKAFPEHHD